MADINFNPNITISNSGIVSGSITNDWTPVGSRENPFNGFFDGKNFSIRGLIISTGYLYSGLFGYADNRAIFKNINISDGKISNTLNGSSTGAICGYNNGLVDNCTNQAFLDIKCNESASGGICGLNDGTVKNSTNWGQVYVSGNNSKAGGFVGINNKTIDNCINNAFIVAQDYVWGYVGGICGQGNCIIACYNSGTVSSASGNSGGIVGEVYADLGTYACYNIGMTSGSYTGGICGYAYNISKYPYSFWLENFGSGLTGNRKENTGEVNINEMQNIANELNDRIIEWNQNNPLAKCEYQFYNIAGDYPKLRKTLK